MTPELIGAYTTAAIAIISAIATAVVTVLKARQTKNQVAGVSAQVTDVHTAVTSTQATSNARVAELMTALTTAGVPVPPPAKPAP
jgi:hypothetical protein